jgi:hypothetical protein
LLLYTEQAAKVSKKVRSKEKSLFHCVSFGIEKQNETNIAIVSIVFCTFAPTL